MKLIENHTMLYIPDGPVLLCMYGAGDCDTIPWPFPEGSAYWTKEKWEGCLRSALFDAREMGEIPDEPTVELPDGTIFTI